MQYNATPCNTMQYHAIPCNTMQYHAIQCNTMQYNAMSCYTMQYHADGAYHCPVGSIMAIFKYRVLFFQPLVMFVSTKKVLWKFKLWQKRHFCANNCNTRRLCKSRCAEYCQLLVQKCLFLSFEFSYAIISEPFSSNQDWNKMFHLPLLQRSKIGQHTGWGAAEVKSVASRRAERLLTWWVFRFEFDKHCPLDFLEGYLQPWKLQPNSLSLKSCSFQFPSLKIDEYLPLAKGGTL